MLVLVHDKLLYWEIVNFRGMMKHARLCFVKLGDVTITADQWYTCISHQPSRTTLRECETAIILDVCGNDRFVRHIAIVGSPEYLKMVEEYPELFV